MGAQDSDHDAVAVTVFDPGNTLWTGVVLHDTTIVVEPDFMPLELVVALGDCVPLYDATCVGDADCALVELSLETGRLLRVAVPEVVI